MGIPHKETEIMQRCPACNEKLAPRVNKRGRADVIVQWQDGHLVYVPVLYCRGCELDNKKKWYQKFVEYMHKKTNRIVIPGVLD